MPAAKIALSWQNLVDASGVTFSSSGDASTDLSVDELGTPIIGRRWRTTSLTGWGQVDLGADQSMGVLALRFPRDTDFPTAGSVRWQLDADGGTAGTGAVYDQTVSIDATAGYGYHVHMPTTAQTARYARFTFSGVSGLSFIDVGRLWLGAAWRPEFNIVLGYSDAWGDLSQVTGSARSGVEFIDTRSRQRLFTFALQALSESERDELREMQRLVGVSRQVLFVKDPDSPSLETVLGRRCRAPTAGRPGDLTGGRRLGRGRGLIARRRTDHPSSTGVWR